MAGNEDTRECEAMRKIFVGGLNKSTTDEVFHEYFQRFGTTEDHIIIREGTSSRGFGFITYNASSAVEQVFQNRPHIIDGKTVDCKRAMPREVNTPAAHSKVNKLFIGGIKGDGIINEQKLQDYFNDRHSGCSGNIEKIEIVKGKPFGFIETSDHDFADRLVISEASFTIDGITMHLQKSDSGAKGGAGGRSGRGGPRGRGAPRGGSNMGRGRGGSGRGSFNRGGSNRGGGGGGSNFNNRGGYNGYSQNNGYDQSGGYQQQQGYQAYDQYNQSGYGAQQSQGYDNQGYGQQYNYDQSYGNYSQGYQNQGQNRYTPY